ncbi:MAG: helix-turn-helix domain-containing protein [Candidatus Sericytochromatia bacterium]|nr:helix-turn-helix domain-containing protein [Candidatus Sericytochromatia bacterium]
MTALTKSVAPTAAEFQAIRALERAFTSDSQARLIAPDGTEMVLPKSVHEVLHLVLTALARGQEITIVPTALELTTQKAAEMLNVSRTFFCKLLAEGEIPFHMVGSHRRIRVEDLVTYKDARDSTRQSKLKELTELAQDMGGYT